MKKGIECTKCGDRIFSEHRHDFRYCKCEAVAIDGGNDYLRILGNTGDFKIIEREDQNDSNR